MKALRKEKARRAVLMHPFGRYSLTRQFTLVMIALIAGTVFRA